jgi:pimeloyl-ACP methyl ester carboxylesterase
MPSEAKARVLANDPEALLAVVDALKAWPTAEDILPAMTLPCLVYAGESDPFYSGARACIDSLPKGTFISLPGLGHTPALYRSDLILPHVTSFLAAVSGVS